MPDEPEGTATAEAEAPKTPDPGPGAGAAEQEAEPDGTQAGASEQEAAEEVDIAGARDGYLKNLGEMAEADPDLKTKLEELYRNDPTEDRAVELDTRDAEQRQGTDLADVQSIVSEATGSASKLIGDWADKGIDGLKQQAEQIGKTGEGSLSGDVIDKLGGQMTSWGSAYKSLGQTEGMLNAFVAFKAALRDTPAHRHLTADDRKTLELSMREVQADPPAALAQLVKLYGDAAGRGVPKEVQTKAKEEAESKVDLVKKYTDLLDSGAIPKNGKRSAAAGAGAAAGKPTTLEEAHKAHAEGKITTAEMRVLKRTLS